MAQGRNAKLSSVPYFYESTIHIQTKMDLNQLPEE